MTIFRAFVYFLCYHDMIEMTTSISVASSWFMNFTTSMSFGSKYGEIHKSGNAPMTAILTPTLVTVIIVLTGMRLS